MAQKTDTTQATCVQCREAFPRRKPNRRRWRCGDCARGGLHAFTCSVACFRAHAKHAHNRIIALRTEVAAAEVRS